MRPKYYWTKKRKQQLKYWAILQAAFVIAVAVIGSSQVSTEKTASWVIESIATPAKAETVNSKQETVEETIRRLAQETGFRWPDYLVRLAHCESRLDPKATNDNGRYGIDRGVFQINSYYHGEVTDAQAFDLEWATRWTMDRINRGYQHEWVCDQIIKKK